MVDACVIELAPETSPDDFRGAMRHLVGAVSVVTAGRGSDITGMTVTSVSSLSIDPPTLIVSINRESSTWPVLKRYGVFGVNVLTSDQIDIAERFSGQNGLKGRVRDLTLSKNESSLAYWHGRYVAIDRDEDISRLAAVGVPYGARSSV